MAGKGNSFTVYEHVFPDGKSYIGITSSGVDKRWENGKGYAGQRKMMAAIETFGWNNVQHRIIADGLDLGQACALERAFIKDRDSVKNGYNSYAGGQPPPHSNLLSPSVNRHLEQQNLHSILKATDDLARLIRQTSNDPVASLFWNDADKAITDRFGRLSNGVDDEIEWWKQMNAYCKIHVDLHGANMEGNANG